MVPLLGLAISAAGSGLSQASDAVLDGAGNLYVADSGHGRLVEVELSTPPALVFPAAPAGTVTAAQVLLLTNLGNQELDAVPPGLTISDDFQIVAGSGTPADCSSGFALPVDATCSLGLAYAPNGDGTLAGTLTITDSAPNSPQTVILTGTPQTIPAITWPTPAVITYGTALSAAQLNATSTVAGTFAYSPAAGTVLTAGTQTLSVTFTPTDTTNYTTATQTASLTVNPAAPAVIWPTPAAITYGTALSAAQLNATSTVAGTFVYTPAAGTMLTAGTQTLSVTFTPSDTTNYTTATQTVSLTVNPAAPAVNWPTPAAITYGTGLSAAQLNATSTVAGTFVYTPAAGTVLPTGTQTLSVTFTPSDTTNYTTATQTVSLTVNAASPTFIWPTPAPITYGTALSAAQLNATSTVSGTFVYTPAAGTMLTAGTQTLSVTFTPADATDYSSVTQTVSLTVNPAAPAVIWPTPAAIFYGTALSGAQLNATSTVAGTFAYSPSAGTVLPAGTHTLSVTFTPADATDYSPVTESVSLTVIPMGYRFGGRPLGSPGPAASISVPVNSGATLGSIQVVTQGASGLGLHTFRYSAIGILRGGNGLGCRTDLRGECSIYADGGGAASGRGAALRQRIDAESSWHGIC